MIFRHPRRKRSNLIRAASGRRQRFYRLCRAFMLQFLHLPCPFLIKLLLIWCHASLSGVGEQWKLLVFSAVHLLIVFTLMVDMITTSGIALPTMLALVALNGRASASHLVFHAQGAATMWDRMVTTLTFCRCIEFLDDRWSEIDLKCRWIVMLKQIELNLIAIDGRVLFCSSCLWFHFLYFFLILLFRLITLILFWEWIISKRSYAN